MKAEEKLREILSRLKDSEGKDKELDMNAFHLRELVPTKTHEIDFTEGYFEWEYTIGEDVLKIKWDVEDVTADEIYIYLNGENVYCCCTWRARNNCLHYDDAAKDLFLLIMQHGGVLESQEDLEHIESWFIDNIIEKRKNRAALYEKEIGGK